MVGFTGIGFLFIFQFSLWPLYATRSEIRTPTPPFAVVRGCPDLKSALSEPFPRDVLVMEDVDCSMDDWGDPVILESDRTIFGVRTNPEIMPTLTFNISGGIVVSGRARLVLQTVILNMHSPQGHGNGDAQAPRPPPAVFLDSNATIDFIGSWVCCEECGLPQYQAYDDQRQVINTGRDSEDSSLALEQRPQTIGALEQLPTGPSDASRGGEDSLITREQTQQMIGGLEERPAYPDWGARPLQGDYVNWEEGKFANGGSYHICGSNFICKPDPRGFSMFTYFVDRSISRCQSRPTEWVVSHMRGKGPRHRPLAIEITAITVPSGVCLILVSLLAALLWRAQTRKGHLTCGPHCDEDVSGSACDSQAASIGNRSQEIYSQDDDRSPVLNRCQGCGKSSLNGSTLSLCFGSVRLDLTKMLGRGGFSTVYKGLFQGNVAAVKVVDHNQHLRAGSSGELVEVQLHRDLYHPCIVVTYCSKTIPIDALPSSHIRRASPTISMGLEGSNEPWEVNVSSTTKNSCDNSCTGPRENMCTLIVMEYCERGNLFEAIHNGEFFKWDAKGIPDMPVILRAALDVANAMCYLHSKGIVHGDLKPENVLRKNVEGDVRGYICKVSDFGLSRTIPIDTFLQTATLGTITHMPPELLENGILGPSADIYSFGIMLWEMISGAFPFQAMGQNEIILTVVNGTRPPLPRNIPQTLWTLITDCWHEDHLQRPSFVTVMQVLQGALQDALIGMPSSYPTLLPPSASADWPETSETWLNPASASAFGTPYAPRQASPTTSSGDIWQSFGAAENKSLSEAVHPMGNTGYPLFQVQRDDPQVGFTSAHRSQTVRSPMGAAMALENILPSPNSSPHMIWRTQPTINSSFQLPCGEHIHLMGNCEEQPQNDSLFEDTPFVSAAEEFIMHMEEDEESEKRMGLPYLTGVDTTLSILLPPEQQDEPDGSSGINFETTLMSVSKSENKNELANSCAQHTQLN